MIRIDMEMPDNCYCCILCRHADMFCRRLGKFLDRDDCYDERDRNCPLHEVTADPDTISRKQAIDALEDDYAYAAAKIIKALPPSPTLSRQPKRTGRWIPVDAYSAYGGDETTWMAHGNPTAFYYCSECKEQNYVGEDGEPLLTECCPHCGARMIRL